MKTISVDQLWQQLRGSAAPVFIEIGQRSFKLLDTDVGVEIALERQGDGRVTSACQDKLSTELKAFLKERGWPLRRRALCAVDARGVSLRWVTLPHSGKDELEGLLRLQIEKEFPLGPDELAWGYRRMGDAELRPRNGSEQSVLIAALKRDRIEEYTSLLVDCGLKPTFTLGALVRSFLVPSLPAGYAILDVGRTDSELATFDHGMPMTVRTLAWGGRHLTEAIQQALGVDFDEAERRKCRLSDEAGRADEVEGAAWEAIRAGLHGLVKSVNQCWDGNLLYLTGETARLKGVAPLLAELLGRKVTIEVIDVPQGKGSSAATQGFKKYWQQSEQSPLLELEATPDAGKRQATERYAVGKWAAVIVLLALASFSLRYIEPIVKKPGLAQRLSEIDQHKQALPEIEHKVRFLQHLEARQPPYLGVLMLLARAAPDKTLFESVSIKPSGALSLQAKLKRSQQAVELRSKLEKTGFFSQVRLDEQAPADGKRKVQVRISADWNPSNARDRLAKAKEVLPKAAPSPETKRPRREGGGPTRRSGPPDLARSGGNEPPER